jgi:hypothetical protein
MGDEAEKVATAPQATDREDEEWNLWKEREFIETLANQRLYFLLVFMGLIIAGATLCVAKLIDVKSAIPEQLL